MKSTVDVQATLVGLPSPTSELCGWVDRLTFRERVYGEADPTAYTSVGTKSSLPWGLLQQEPDANCVRKGMFLVCCNDRPVSLVAVVICIAQAR